MELKEIVIRRPRAIEVNDILAFFKTVLKDTFEVNEISDLTELLTEEIEAKKSYLEEDFRTHGKDRFFLIADYNGTIIGSIEYGSQNELLKGCTNSELEGMFEIGTVFVHPNYQRLGLSSILFYSLFQELHRKEVEEVCFDSGYKLAQKVWRSKFGNPNYLLEDFWGRGSHHMVWVVRIDTALQALKEKQSFSEI